MPAHSEEVLTAYPELSCTHEPYKQADFCVGNEKNFAFLENVLTEVMELFPSEYIHICLLYTSIDRQKLQAVTGADGKWAVDVRPLKAGGPYTLTVP